MSRSSLRDDVQRVFAALDWHALGAIYCEEGGDAFWDAHRDAAKNLGLVWAKSLARRLSPNGVSLWVGAGVAEIPALCAERRLPGRRVVACNLREAECEVLNAGLSELDTEGSGIRIEAKSAIDCLGHGPFDHLSLVSVLSDPEIWPVCSGIGYGRLPPALIDVDALRREQTELLSLSEALLGSLQSDAWITTTGEEVPWLLHTASSHGTELIADDESIETALVGDPIGFLRVKRSVGGN